jgi:hypothetical protein
MTREGIKGKGKRRGKTRRIQEKKFIKEEKQEARKERQRRKQNQNNSCDRFLSFILLNGTGEIPRCLAHPVPFSCCLARVDTPPLKTRAS